MQRIALCLIALTLTAQTVLALQPALETGLEVHQPWLENARVLPHVTSRPTTIERDALNESLPGTWEVRWNRLTRTPHRAYGSGLELPDVDGTADGRSRAFVDEHPEWFVTRSNDLRLLGEVSAAGHTSALYLQTVDGVAIEGARIDFLYGPDGRLVLFGADAHRDVDLSTVPGLSPGAAIDAALVGMPGGRLAFDGDPELRILPIPGEQSGTDELRYTYHLAYRVIVDTEEPIGRWVTWVDAQRGSVIWRYNDIHFVDYDGTVTADVEDFDYCAGVAGQPLADLTVSVSGVGSVDTGADGTYSITPPDNSSRVLSAELRGAHVNVNNQVGPDASISMNVPPGTHDLHWDNGNSQQDERDVYLHTDRAYKFIRGIDPTTPLGVIDGSLSANVRVSGTCNAYWNGNSINFYAEGGGCANTGQIGDVVYHEYGHGVTDGIYASGPPGDLHEGNSDIIAAHMTESPIIGNGFNQVCGQGIRNCDNTLRYPEDVVGQEGHSAGRVICGFDWDARKNIEVMNPAIYKTHSDSLWHFTRVLTRPQSQPDQVEVYFFLDDDDVNISNGSPHYSALCAAADKHGFTPPGPASVTPITITHDALHSTTSQAPYPVVADISSTAGNIDPAESRVVYRVNDGPPQEVPLVSGGGTTWMSEIPAQTVGTRVSYAIVTGDDAGNLATYPPNPCFPGDISGEEVFHVASLVDELEVQGDWVVGAPDDDATTGIWELIDPNPTAAQPGDDRTPAPGVYAFITGQCPPGCGLGDNDVDGGKTTVFSPEIDLSGYVQAEVLYHRWYSNDTGATPGTDFWVVDASPDGGTTWVNVEDTNESDASWREVRVDLNALFGSLPATVKFRFVASDYEPGSLVEAGVDELMVFGSATTGIETPDRTPEVRYALDGAVPNPFNPQTSIQFTVGSRAPVTLAIFDVSGRLVRELLSGANFEAGQHEVRWDGRDARGAMSSTGVYYVQMSAPGYRATEKLVLLK